MGDEVGRGSPLDGSDKNCEGTHTQKKHTPSQSLITSDPSRPSCLVSKSGASMKTNLACPGNKGIGSVIGSRYGYRVAN